MAQRFIDSFDHYVIGDISRKWLLTNGGSGSSSLITGRTGNCWDSGSSVLGSSQLTKVLDNQPTWIIGSAFRVPSGFANAKPIYSLLDVSSSQLEIRTTSAGNITVTRNGTILDTSVLTLALNTFHYIELKATIHNTTGSYEVHVDGVTWLSATNVDTQTSANAYANAIVLGSTLSGVIQFDDLYIFDGTGSQNNNFAGDVAITYTLANSAGDLAQWTPSAGSNFQCVDENPNDGDTTYVSSSTIGQQDLYNFTNISGAATSVLGIQRIVVARKDDAGTRLIKPIYKGGGTIFQGTAVSLTSSYVWLLDTLEADPATSSPWTLADLNAAQFGVELDT